MATYYYDTTDRDLPEDDGINQPFVEAASDSEALEILKDKNMDVVYTEDGESHRIVWERIPGG